MLPSMTKGGIVELCVVIDVKVIDKEIVVYHIISSGRGVCWQRNN
jgi:hypothetical protein